MTPVRLKLAVLRSRVKHSTEPLRSDCLFYFRVNAIILVRFPQVGVPKLYFSFLEETVNKFKPKKVLVIILWPVVPM